MRNVIAVMLVAAALAGCTATEQGAAIGAASGAAIGGVAGALIGRASEHPGQCYYRDRYGRKYLARCPRGY